MVIISQYDVIYYLRDELPQISETFYPTRIGCSLYTSLQTLAEYTRECIKEHHLNIARKCFTLASTFYTYGDGMVKNAVINIFIDSICSFVKNDARQEIVIQAMMPASLLKIYLKRKIS